MTLAELRALRPVWRDGSTLTPDEVIRRFVQLAWRCGYGEAPAEMALADLDGAELGMCGVAGVWLKPSDPDGVQAFANDAAREYRSRVGRYQDAAPSALDWLVNLPRGPRSYLVAHLRCPKGKLLAQLYCLPEDSAPVRDSGGHRLLIEPTNRGQLTQIGVKSNAATPDTGTAWWYISDDDVWDLRCKCCPRPDGGVRARDFLIHGTDDRGHRLVLC